MLTRKVFAMTSKLFLCVVVLCFLCTNVAAKGNKLIVVLIDGFRWDYTNDPKIQLKGIPKIIENGVRAAYVDPVYPSLSYPNWYSIVTGLYSESHSFVNNIMYDNRTGSSFLMFPHKGSTDPHWWNGAEPIWVTAEKQGRYAAMYWWVGCEINIKDVQPMICERHRYGPGTAEEKTDFLERIDDVIALFKPSNLNRLSLALMYYGSVDYTGHYSGPGSPDTRRALKDIDDVLYEMLNKIKKAGLEDEVNIMVVSDHGMTDVQEAKYLDLEKFASNIKFQIASGAASMLIPQEGKLDKLYQDLKGANIKGMKIFKKEEIPTSYHLKNNPLVYDIFLEAEKGHLIKALNDSSKRIGSPTYRYKGVHGYHPDEVTDMRTIFFATGPGFKKGHTIPSASNVDMYNMMCDILEITPLPNNGSLKVLKEALSSEDTSHLTSSATHLTFRWLCYIFSSLILMFMF